MAGKGGEDSNLEGKRPDLGIHQKKKSVIRTIFVNIVHFVVNKIQGGDILLRPAGHGESEPG
jgi:hypothetical protein